MRKKRLTVVIMGALLVGSLAGCGMSAALPGRGHDAAQGYDEAQIYGMTQGYGALQREAALPQVSYETTAIVSYAGECGEPWTNEDASGEQFRIYEPFGMTYDAYRNELYYNGKSVRWFEDYYPVGEDPQAQAGRDFFNESGVVDVDRKSVV